MPEDLPPPGPDEGEIGELFDELEVHSIPIVPEQPSVGHCLITWDCSFTCS